MLNTVQRLEKTIKKLKSDTRSDHKIIHEQDMKLQAISYRLTDMRLSRDKFRRDAENIGNLLFDKSIKGLLTRLFYKS